MLDTLRPVRKCQNLDSLGIGSHYAQRRVNDDNARASRHNIHLSLSFQAAAECI
jgi:hypothetical protein